MDEAALRQARETAEAALAVLFVQAKAGRKGEVLNELAKWAQTQAEQRASHHLTDADIASRRRESAGATRADVEPDPNDEPKFRAVSASILLEVQRGKLRTEALALQGHWRSQPQSVDREAGDAFLDKINATVAAILALAQSISGYVALLTATGDREQAVQAQRLAGQLELERQVARFYSAL